MEFIEPCYVRSHTVGLVVASISRRGSRLFPTLGHVYSISFRDSDELRPVRSICSIGYTDNTLPFEIAYEHAYDYSIRMRHASIIDFNRRNHINEEGSEIILNKIRG